MKILCFSKNSVLLYKIEILILFFLISIKYRTYYKIFESAMHHCNICKKFMN